MYYHENKYNDNNIFVKDFKENVNETFVYKMLQDTLKHAKPNFLHEYANDSNFQECLYEIWNKTVKKIHKGRMYGQFAVKEALQKATEGKYRYPKDVAKLIGLYTKMEGGARKQSKRKCKKCDNYH